MDSLNAINALSGRSVQLSPECRAALEKNPSQRDAEDIHHLVTFLSSQKAFSDTEKDTIRELSYTLTYERIAAVVDGQAVLVFLNITSAIQTSGQTTSMTIAAGEKVGELAVLRKDTSFKITVNEDVEAIRIHPTDYMRLMGHDVGKKILDGAELIKNVNIFCTLAWSALAPVCEALQRVSYPPNTVIIKQEDDPDGMYLVSSGQCRVIMKAKVEDKWKLLEIGVLRRHSYFGEVSLMKGDGRRASIVSTTNVVCYRLPKSTFHRYITGQSLNDLDERIASYPSESDIVANFMDGQKWANRKLKMLDYALAHPRGTDIK